MFLILFSYFTGLMKKTGSSRIINVSSIAHLAPGFNINDLNFKDRSYNNFSSYNQSKACNVIFTKELTRKLQGSGNLDT